MDTTSKSTRATGKYAEKISKKDSRELISSGKAILRNELRTTSSEMMFNFYIVDDMKLLVVLLFDGSSILYHSYEDYLKMLKETDSKFKQLFPGKDAKRELTQEDYLKSNRSEFEVLITNGPSILSQKLNIDVNELDFSEGSLATISTRVNQMIESKDRFDVGLEYLDVLVAYFGECVRRRVKGEWTIDDIDGKITRLEITNQLKGTHAPHWYLNEAFFNSAKKIDLSGEFKIQVVGFPAE